MVHIDFKPDTLQGEKKDKWDELLEKSKIATKEIIETWETKGKITEKDFKNGVWKEFKDWLLDNVFYGKCAYCETDLKKMRADSHAEHWRPKGAVKYKKVDASGKTSEEFFEAHGKLKQVIAKVIDPQGNEINHPGYFWLAYHWENLFPSCPHCNAGEGKKNLFPIAENGNYQLLSDNPPGSTGDLPWHSQESTKYPGYYYLVPDEMDRLEDPMLLHPYDDGDNEIKRHIKFGDKGIIAAIEKNNKVSVRGLHSIAVYNLDAESLRGLRQDLQEKAENAYLLKFLNYRSDGLTQDEAKKKAWQFARKKFIVNKPYSLAVKQLLTKVKIGGG